MTDATRPLLLVISGLPGSGKSALAEGMARHLGAVHLSIDVVEEALLKAGCPNGWTTGVAAYEAVGALAAANLALGTSVCVDAVSDSDAARHTWRRAADGSSARLLFLVTTCPDPAEHRRRLEARTRPFTHVLEPTWDEVQTRAARYEPWIDSHIVIETGRSLKQALDDAMIALATPG